MHEVVQKAPELYIKRMEDPQIVLEPEGPAGALLSQRVQLGPLPSQRVQLPSMLGKQRLGYMGIIRCLAVRLLELLDMLRDQGKTVLGKCTIYDQLVHLYGKDAIKVMFNE